MVLCWTLNPFFKKTVTKKMKSNEYLIVNHIIISVFILLYFLYLNKYNKCDLNCIKKLSGYDLFLLSLGAITSIGGTIAIIEAVNLEDVSYIIANVQPMVIVMTALLGYLFLQEKINFERSIGMVFIVIGLVILNNK